MDSFLFLCELFPSMPLSMPNTEGKRIKSLDTAFDIIELLGKDEGMTQTDLADRLDYSKSTIHYYLRTLEANRYVKRRDGKYRLCLRCLKIGELAREQHGFPRVIVRESDMLANKTGETAVVAVEEGGKSVYIHRSWPKEGDSINCRQGADHYLHTTAFGKAILASMPESQVREIVDHYGLPEVTENSIIELETLLDELETTREKGIAFDDGEHRAGVRSIAAPIAHTDGEVYGAVGIIGSAEILDDPHAHAKAQRFAESPSNIVKRFSHIINNKIGDQ